MKLHPDRSHFLQRVEKRMDDFVSAFEGPVYRFVDPRFSSVEDMFAGKGAFYANGRWLLKGKRLATYTATSPETALVESLAACRYYGFPDENAAPLVFVTARIRLTRVIDLSCGKIRQRLQISESKILDCDWRQANDENLGNGAEESLTQAWGWALAEAGAEAIVAPSSAARGGTNVILFPGNFEDPDQLRVLKKIEWPKS